MLEAQGKQIPIHNRHERNVISVTPQAPENNLEPSKIRLAYCAYSETVAILHAIDAIDNLNLLMDEGA